MKCRVEHADLRNGGEVCLARDNTANIVRIVQRGNLDVVPQTLDDSRCDQNRAGKCFIAVHHTVSDRVNIIFRCKNAVIFA